jgi:hypothetical protein
MPMSTRLSSLLLFHLALATTGCVTSTVSQALPDKAYLVHGHMFGTEIYNCFDAASGPTCVPVVEEPLP